MCKHNAYTRTNNLGTSSHQHQLHPTSRAEILPHIFAVSAPLAVNSAVAASGSHLHHTRCFHNSISAYLNTSGCFRPVVVPQLRWLPEGARQGRAQVRACRGGGEPPTSASHRGREHVADGDLRLHGPTVWGVRRKIGVTRKMQLARTAVQTEQNKNARSSQL